MRRIDTDFKYGGYESVEGMSDYIKIDVQIFFANFAPLWHREKII